MIITRKMKWKNLQNISSIFFLIKFNRCKTAFQEIWSEQTSRGGKEMNHRTDHHPLRVCSYSVRESLALPQLRNDCSITRTCAEHQACKARMQGRTQHMWWAWYRESVLMGRGRNSSPLRTIPGVVEVQRSYPRSQITAFKQLNFPPSVFLLFNYLQLNWIQNADPKARKTV